MDLGTQQSPATWQRRHYSQEGCKGRCSSHVHVHVQVALGIATLWSYVRPELGASHQASALALFTIALALLHSVQSISYKPTAMSRMLGPAAAVAVAGVAVAVSSLQ